MIGVGNNLWTASSLSFVEYIMVTVMHSLIMQSLSMFCCYQQLGDW